MKPLRPTIIVVTVMVTLACSDKGGGDRAGGAAAAGGAAGGAAIFPGERRNLIAAGPGHFCALRTSGLYCWGEDLFGELGTGAIQPSKTPVLATVAGKDIVELAVNTGRTCVRRSTGEVACWGANDLGQIGDGTHTDSLVPVPVSGIQDALAIALDTASTCVLRRDHTVACWGMSPKASPESGSAVPRPIAGLSGIQEIRNGTMGSYCGRNAQGDVFCWMFNETEWTAPKEVTDLKGSRAIAMAAWDEICGIVASGMILCNNFASTKTVPLSGSENSVIVIAAGGLAACGKNASELWQCWNVLPPLLEAVGSTPVAVPSPVPIRDLVIGGFLVCVLREDGVVACANADETGLMPAPGTELKIVEGLPPQ